MKLSETRDKGGRIVAARIGQFIAEHEGEVGDADALEATIRSMAGKSKVVQVASSPDGSGD